LRSGFITSCVSVPTRCCKQLAAMVEFVELVGETLHGKTSEVSTTEALSGKRGVLLYFSAHWCPPCRAFTPKLAEFYAKHSAAKGFEIVFVSSDKSQAEFDAYYGEMPWLALPWADRKKKEALSKTYQVGGIPTLIVLDPSGKVTTTNGRAMVMEDFKACEDFPWLPLTLWEALGDSLVRKDGRTVTTDELRGKTLGLYFSAHWCPPCRDFTPKLKAFYEEYTANNNDFEIIFISSDHNEREMWSYFKDEHGDYVALPFFRRKEEVALSDMCRVEGMPALAIVGPDGTIINRNGREKVLAGARTVLEGGWDPPIVGDMDQGSGIAGTDMIQCPAIVVLCEGCDDATHLSVRQVLEPFAKKYIDEAQKTGEDLKYIFLVAGGGTSARQVKSLTQHEAGACVASAAQERRPVVFLFDIPDEGSFYVSSATEVTSIGIEEFLKSHEAGQQKRLQLGRPRRPGFCARLCQCMGLIR